MITFQEPPVSKRTDVRSIVQQLQQQPNQWAIVRTYECERQQAAHTYASHIRTGRFPGFKGCDARACTENNVVNVYARWISDASS